MGLADSHAVTSMRFLDNNIMKKTLFILVALALCSFCGQARFKPAHSPNPWPDNYEADSLLTHPDRWGTYNVHDPSMRKVGEYYYMYSTDAVYMPRNLVKKENVPQMGFLQMRRSKDLVNWEFLGWAFDSIPRTGAEWVESVNDGVGPGNIWAPYMVPAPDGKTFRLYYCVSAFAKKTSAICMAEAASPEGPWTDRGCVVKTHGGSPMNAIDPTIIITPEGKYWMHYGSYFGGIYCVELNPATGFTVKPHDKGHLVARRANYRKDNLEAPEILYVPETGKHYLFGSYDPLMTTYNVRVGRGDNPAGPFTDFFGKELADTTDNFPILTNPYRFREHPGWKGTAHCGVVSDGEGRYFMAHQGRLAPEGMMMCLHLRQMFFTPDGWPVVSPERYCGTTVRKFKKSDLAGEWEIIRVIEPRAERRLEAGQILWGEGDLLPGECDDSETFIIRGSGSTDGRISGISFDEKSQLLSLTLDGTEITGLVVHAGHDWEREQDTVLFTGLDPQGRSVWGKRVK